MWEIAELWSGSAIPLPPPHPAQKNRTARARSGTHNTGVPAPTEAEVQAVPPQQWVRVVVVPAFSRFSWGRNYDGSENNVSMRMLAAPPPALKRLFSMWNFSVGLKAHSPELKFGAPTMNA